MRTLWYGMCLTTSYYEVGFISKIAFVATTNDLSDGLSTEGESPVSEKCRPIKLWKPDVALRRMGGDIELLSSMVDYFLEDSPALLAELQQLVEDGNTAEATRAAHSLKGLCSNFEAVEATQAGLEVESGCMSGKLQDVKQRLPQLLQTFARLSQELIEWQSRQVSAG